MPAVLSFGSSRFLTPSPLAISSLCRSGWLVFIMTPYTLVEGTDEYFIAGLAMKVRSGLGFSMLESTYERALMIELEKAGMPAKRQVPISVYYDGKKLDYGYLADIIVDNRILLELKAVSRLCASHRRQIRFYLSASGIQSGLLINFGNPKRIECERFEWRDSGYRISGTPEISDRPYQNSPQDSNSSDTASLSLTDRVNRMLGIDANAGNDAEIRGDI